MLGCQTLFPSLDLHTNLSFYLVSNICISPNTVKSSIISRYNGCYYLLSLIYYDLFPCVFHGFQRVRTRGNR